MGENSRIVNSQELIRFKLRKQHFFYVISLYKGNLINYLYPSTKTKKNRLNLRFSLLTYFYYKLFALFI